MTMSQHSSLQPLVAYSCGGGSSLVSPAVQLLSSRRKHSDSTESVDTASARLSDLVNYAESVKFRGFDHPRRYWEMSSFEETKAAQLSASAQAAARFVAHNRRHLSRVYPRGTRLLSSNLDPLRAWLSGCQMAALNYQARDRPLLFSRAMFRQNGRTGYVLKPSFMRGSNII